MDYSTEERRVIRAGYEIEEGSQLDWQKPKIDARWH